ncbi:hypothetical protein NC652_014142 [Populus alba x Populus x berolinensis]|nr:hypothetical protein NC652_014142 [Populus alba x Populus x berolinensis]
MLCIILLLLCLTFMFHGRAWQSTRSSQRLALWTCDWCRSQKCSQR